MLRVPLRALLFDANLTSPTLLADLTDLVEDLRFGTALHGGFKACTFRLALSRPDAWLWIAEKDAKGRFFNRLVVYEEKRVIWEGRVMDVELHLTSDFHGLFVTALGYWSACRDQYYDAADAGNTNWAAGGPHTVDDIIKEMLTKECPDINTDQSNIDANSRNVVGLDLTARDYPQNIIVEQLATLSDSDASVWYFAIWNDRKAWWKARSIATLHYLVFLDVLESLTLRQSAGGLRNAIIPVDGTTEGTVQTDADSLVLYPRRELLLTVPAGSPANAEADAAGTAAVERADPRQSESFVVSGKLYNGDGAEVPKWRVRAGETIRIQDLVPESAASPALDIVRTFFILETEYDASRDMLIIQPDTFSRNLSGLLPRLGAMERKR